MNQSTSGLHVTKRTIVGALVMPVAVRRYNRGWMPGKTGDEALKKVALEEECFLYPDIELTKEEKINLILLN